MGRPPLKFQETKIRISSEMRARIQALVGNYRISAFIREAIEHELDRREKIRSKPEKSQEGK